MRKSDGVNMQASGVDISRFNDPLLDITGFGTEVDTDFKEFTSVRFKREGVTFLVNLLKSLLRCAVKLEFHYIDELIRLKDKVDATMARMVFNFRIEAYELEDDKKDILVMQFPLADHFVGSVGKETLQTAEEGVIVTGTYLTDKLLDFKGRLYLIHIRVIGKKETDETLLHFAIGKAKAVYAELFIIAFDGKVAALVDYENRIASSRNGAFAAI